MFSAQMAQEGTQRRPPAGSPHRQGFSFASSPVIPATASRLGGDQATANPSPQTAASPTAASLPQHLYLKQKQGVGESAAQASAPNVPALPSGGSALRGRERGNLWAGALLSPWASPGWDRRKAKLAVEICVQPFTQGFYRRGGCLSGLRKSVFEVMRAAAWRSRQGSGWCCSGEGMGLCVLRLLLQRCTAVARA